MRWWVKAATQSVLARVPMGEQVHEWLQMRYGELAALERCSRFGNAALILEKAKTWPGLSARLRVVELGTGWVPAVPLALALAGARVETFDVKRLVRPTIYARSLRELGRHLPELARAADIPVAALIERFARIEGDLDLTTSLATLEGAYHAPWDTRQLPYANGEVDLVISNLVLQNIERSVLEPVLLETARVLRCGGFALHRVGLDDEYAAVDPRRGSLDFLRYSTSRWDFFCSHSIKYVNRLRYSQFMDLFARCGFRTAWIASQVERDAIPRLQQQGVAPEFRGLEWEDLATTSFTIVLQKPGACTDNGGDSSPRRDQHENG